MDNKFYTYLHRKADTGEIFYVGKGKGMRFCSTNKRNKHWQSVVHKHGFIAQIILANLNEQSAFETERSLISLLKMTGVKLANKTDGGEGPSGMKHTAETKTKWSLAKTGKKRGQYSSEHRRKISESLKGRTFSEETKIKISQATKLAMQNPEVKQKMIDAKLGKKRPNHSEATRQKMSVSAINRWLNRNLYATKG